MAINVENIAKIYDKLEEKVLKTTDTFIDNYSIKESDKATIVSSAINTLITVSVSASQQQELNEAQIGEINASKDLKVQEKTNSADENTRANGLNAKEIMLKQAQTDLANMDKSIKEYQLSSILPQELANLIKDGTTKANQALLITRQKTAYDDNLRVEEAKALKDVVFGYAVGGTLPPNDLQTSMLNAVNAVTP